MSAIEDNISRISKEQWTDGYQQGRSDALTEIFSKMEQPDRCIFNSKNDCCYPVSSCWECPISELKEYNNE